MCVARIVDRTCIMYRGQFIQYIRHITRTVHHTTHRIRQFGVNKLQIVDRNESLFAFNAGTPQ